MPLRRRRPLLRAAAVGGGAYLAGKHAGERRQATSATDVTDGGSDPTLDRLRQLGELHDSGVLTDDEFAAQKSRLLGA